jgi:hypothetical protein
VVEVLIAPLGTRTEDAMAWRRVDMAEPPTGGLVNLAICLRCLGRRPQPGPFATYQGWERWALAHEHQVQPVYALARVCR